MCTMHNVQCMTEGTVLYCVHCTMYKLQHILRTFELTVIFVQLVCSPPPVATAGAVFPHQSAFPAPFSMFLLAAATVLYVPLTPLPSA